MSAPATNAFSPEPVRTIALTWSSPLHSSIARRSSSMVWEFSAFKTFGRLMVMTTIAPSWSRRRLSKLMASRIRLRESGSHASNRHRGGGAHRENKPQRHKDTEKLCVSVSPWLIYSQRAHACSVNSLERKRIHQPAEHERRQQKPAEQQAAEPNLFGHT